MPATLIDQPKPQPQPQPQQSAAPASSTGGATLIDPGGQTGSGQPTIPGAAPAQNATGHATLVTGDQTSGDSGAGKPGFNWRDWNSIAANESSMGTLPGLRTQAEEARKRLDPVSAMSADFAGNILSPTQLVTPFLGPEAAGALHEGIKSAVTNWRPDESWPTYLKNVGEDATFGGLTGGLSRIGANQAPQHFGDATREIVKGIPAALLGLHAYTAGAGTMLHNAVEASKVLGAYGLMTPVASWAGRQVEHLGETPAVQQAIKSVILGGGSAIRQQVPGPLDQLFVGP